jgi:hypothetical protein
MTEDMKELFPIEVWKPAENRGSVGVTIDARIYLEDVEATSETPRDVNVWGSIVIDGQRVTFYDTENLIAAVALLVRDGKKAARKRRRPAPPRQPGSRSLRVGGVELDL